ncbi:MAG: amidohydrolase family protein [Gammaproteobacteria bacterium]|nr:amidohydrolase family protein [Gammaproteobacteria bacterium]
MKAVTYTNLRIWDGIASDYSEETSLSIQNGSISAIGKSGPNSRDMAGLTVIPGLIDSHVHMTLDPAILSMEQQLAQTDEEIHPKMDTRAREMVHAGITTARDLGGGRWLELGLRNRIARKEVPGPRLLCAGQPLTSKDGHCHFWGGVATCNSEIEEVINRQHTHEVDLIKVMATGGMYTKISKPGLAQFSQQEFDFAVRTANSLGYRVAAHCHGTQGISRAALAGVDTIEHCSWLGLDGSRSTCDKKVAREIAKRKIWVSPTVNAGWARFMAGNGKFERLLRGLFKTMKEAGIQFIASTDAGIPNVKHHELARSLEVFAKLAGLSCVETLRTATSNAAQALAIDHVTGTIESGKVADLLFVEGNPMKDLGALQRPALVVSQGTEYEIRS